MSDQTRLKKYVGQIISKNYDGLIGVYNSDIFNRYHTSPNHTDRKLYHPDVATRIFRSMFARFGKFIDRLNLEKIKYLIGGSTALFSVYNIEDKHIQGFMLTPNDVDMYMFENEPVQVRKIDNIIRKLYKDGEIHVSRTPYTINWWIDGISYAPRIQLILPVPSHIADIFGTYHSDAVCIGYDGYKFVYAKNRFDRFLETGDNWFSIYTVQPEFINKIRRAFSKYKQRGFIRIGDKQIQEKTNAEIDSVIDDKNVSMYIDQFSDVDFKKFKELYGDNPFVKISDSLYDVYSGEFLKPFLLAFADFHTCNVCQKLILHKRICDICKELEESKLVHLIQTISSHKHKINVLITGGRCGLGNAVAKTLKENSDYIIPYITTRYPNLVDFNDNVIELDLKNSEGWKETTKMIEDGVFDILILSASETLHYQESDEEIKQLKKDEVEFDFTNDIQRKNTGVWHKTLKDHTDSEMTDPISVNLVGNTALLRAFMKCCYKDQKPRLAVVVTSFEGSFEVKTPFHPMTNASKAGIEQVVHTLQREVNFLGSFVSLVDPGWVYTEGIMGKKKGYINIEWGARQILEPVVEFIDTGNVGRKKYSRRM